MKLAHLQLHDSWDNKQTLIAHIKDGSICYRYYTGWGSSGIPLALDNLCLGYKHRSSLPLDNHRDLSVVEWRDLLCGIINTDSTKRVINVIPNEVTFNK
jgi:hypothetical protein